MEKHKKLLNTSMFSEFKNTNYAAGVFTLQLTSWDEFHRVVEIFNNNTRYFWRGQEKDWELKSSFDRNPFIQKSTYLLNRQEVLNALLEKFKKRLSDLQGVPIVDDDDKVWEIGQSYGLPTPLLDWTVNPYVAAYFAFYKRGTDNRCRIVYALNKTVKRLLQKKGPKTKNRFLDFLDLTESSDKIQNTRLKAQEGRFTKSLNGVDIESNILKKYTEKRPSIDEILLIKIFMSDLLREECLRYLTSKDFTHGKLFPDFSGAVEICKIDLGIEKPQNSLLN